MKARFGGPVRKVSLDAGLTCPNREGSARRGGCAWCDPGGSGPDDPAADEPWQDRLRRLASTEGRRGDRGAIAYFQAFTNTCGAPASELESMWRRALETPGVLGLAIGTRPDCLPAPVLGALSRLNESAFLWVELGMQSASDATLRAMNRGHGHGDTAAAAEALRERGIRTVLHLILGLPGEDEKAMRASLLEAARLKPWGVKLHPLHVVRGSALEPRWRAGRIDLLTREAYAGIAADGIEVLSPDSTIHRLTGERPPGILLAPAWCADKRRTLGAITRELARRGSWQGIKCQS